MRLPEHTPVTFHKNEISPTIARALWETYAQPGGPLTIDFPTPATNDQWQFTNRGFVGLLPLPDGGVLQLLPKIPLDDLFALLEYAFDWRNFHLLDAVIPCETLAAFYDRLAALLARRTLQRVRRGLHRAFVAETAALPAIRGRIVNRPLTAAAPLVSQFSRSTTAVDDNHLLAWTLRRIARGRLCTPATHALVRRAAHALPPPPRPYTAADCRDRAYTRLNNDYRPLHALCRFFLADGGPAIDPGPELLPPFLVDMAALYERFVAAWLAENRPAGWHLRAQEQLDAGGLRYRVDLLLDDGRGHRIVLDTKYKSSDRPHPADINQVVAYAQLAGARTAVLVYPDPNLAGHTFTFDQLQVRTLAFPLTGELAAHGRAIIKQLT